ncbi:MAG: 16S rRNA (uracil(1498)-N(3))-methyltransferase [Alphaproteobacteria bacterium]|nr:16S rRNA (uracil(1498)-N(3))-methyltransferase [Alphaproteobacteria bacterium]
MKHIPRFFVENEIVCGVEKSISPEQMFHASKVLRLRENNCIRIFNNISGEWECSIKSSKKNLVTPLKLIKVPRDEFGPSIACALINPNRFSIMVEKVTELGVQNIYPLITDYTQYKTFSKQKVKQAVVQACEQSGRLTVPKIHEAVKLKDFLSNLSENQKILVGVEKENTTRMMYCLEKDIIFAVGPEGGFSNQEIELFNSTPSVNSFYFGRNILRSETAAVAFISLWVAKYL